MVNFWQMHTEIFKNRIKMVYSIWLIQIIVVILGPLMAIATRNKDLLFGYSAEGELSYAYLNMIIYSIAGFAIIFLVLMCIKNYRLLKSETWHLIPLSNKKLLNANLLATWSLCAFFFIGQIIGFFIFMTIFRTNDLADLGKDIYLSVSDSALDNKFLTFIIFTSIVTFLVQLIWAFLEFASQALSDLGKDKNPKASKMFYELIIILIGTYAFSWIHNFYTSIYNQIQLKLHGHASLNSTQISDFYLPLISLVIFLVIFYIIDLWLFDKHYEPRSNNN